MFLQLVYGYLISILLLGSMIFLHELGHFIAARLMGIKVDKFAFGFPIGPTLYSKKVGDVEILVHAFLFGGYVSFPDDDEECTLAKDSPLRFINQPVYKRVIVISAGVLFNLFLAYAFVLIAGLCWQHLPTNQYAVKVEKISPIASEIVKNSGLQAGDTFYEINNTIIKYPNTPSLFFKYSKEFDGSVKKEIFDKKLEQLKELNPNIANLEEINAGTNINIPDFTDEDPVLLTQDNILGIKDYGTDEEKLSEKQIDLRNKINYQTNYTLEENSTLADIAYAISDTKKPLSIVVKRDNDIVPINTVYTNKEGLLGFILSLDEKYLETKNIKDLWTGTNNYIKYHFDLIIYSLKKVFSGQVHVSKFNGVLAITKICAETIAFKGLFNGILLAAVISLNLAVFNLLPIPALDGGHLMFLIIEKITGKPVKKEIVEKISNVFFYLLIALIILICCNDIIGIATGKI